MTDKFDGWITADEWCEKYADRRNTIHVRINQGAWQRGVHYSAPDPARCYVHEERCKAWMIAHGKLRV